MALLNALIDSSRYGSVTVLREVGLIVEEGELVVVLGGNGAGKTTLLRTISGVMVRMRGELSFEGEDIRRLPSHRRAQAGIIHVPEGRHVFAGLTVAENLAMGALAARGRATGEAADRVHELFPALRPRAADDARSLSGGQQQMLAIGRALMGEPRLLMVDEASLGLSPALTSEVLGALREISDQGTSVLLVEQNARAALRIANRAYVLERGRVALAGTAQELQADDRVANLYLGGQGNTRRKQ